MNRIVALCLVFVGPIAAAELFGILNPGLLARFMDHIAKAL